ncbi:hypothetical protein ACQR16_07525 [Bradyrhizobium oligotrophicum]|uniref:hypothetical protein n=1 Tax=Bradyrhizobium oligotrophicum TaxID=44255 RepID=UPI003EBDF1C3
MSQTGKVVVLGTLAASALMLAGAMQFAAGHDLTADLRGQTSSNDLLEETSSTVNRTAKADRVGLVAEVPPTKTVSIKLAAFADTSFLLRLPIAASSTAAGQRSAPQGSQTISAQNERRGAARQPVACEPSVSVLTEIAKRLQPGRCVT